jgi:hypothetical protein
MTKSIAEIKAMTPQEVFSLTPDAAGILRKTLADEYPPRVQAPTWVQQATRILGEIWNGYHGAAEVLAQEAPKHFTDRELAKIRAGLRAKEQQLKKSWVIDVPKAAA